MAPSGQHRRVSYTVSDSMSRRRRANEHGTEDLFHDVPAHQITRLRRQGELPNSHKLFISTRLGPFMNDAR